ncbi:dihydrolipoyl dehydrogenase [Fredinandcohnia quinoae]|uniref:Dihydrolipoyl dehydrogenase n=1 Tax=Fredinandcohnia quinoae TaxID=2918902 RepID=A0AAW5EEL2_9BACI|nr:dihydrolipoyl dehydrogenase [Fredinandcohnia sp. SECRCQ15]MCH1627941.1 dihydrolipoyl dehydrogenase [Fredinandcohnia sp. SECRCQ15]
MVVGELAYERDLLIIGGGPGGYNAAIRAAQLGKSVTLIEREQLGGVCLNKGCIPSKVFTHAADKLYSYQKNEQLGIECDTLTFNYSKLEKYKNKIVDQLRQGVEALCQSNQIELLMGNAFFLSENKIGVEKDEQYEIYQFKNAIIATGCSPKSNKLFSKLDSKKVLNHWSISTVREVPDRLIIYGSDYITLEMAMSFRAFGSTVSILLDDGKEEFPFDPAINRELERILKKKKIAIFKGVIKEVKEDGSAVMIDVVRKESVKTIIGSYLFVSNHYIPNTKELGLERIGIQIDQDGFIVTNEKCQTSVNHIYAVGDVTGGEQLAIKAIKEGKVASEAISGIPSEIDITNIPTIVRAVPPIASVGLTENEAIESGYEISTGQFSLNGNGFATLIDKKEGLIKVIIDKKSQLILGVHIIGEGAVELISTGIHALEMIAREEDLLFPLYPHPSINEGLLEAIEALSGLSIHTAQRKKSKEIAQF